MVTTRDIRVISCSALEFIALLNNSFCHFFLCIMFRILFLFDVLNGNLYLFHSDSCNNFCFKRLNCDIYF